MLCDRVWRHNHAAAERSSGECVVSNGVEDSSANLIQTGASGLLNDLRNQCSVQWRFIKLQFNRYIWMLKQLPRVQVQQCDVKTIYSNAISVGIDSVFIHSGQWTAESMMLMHNLFSICVQRL